jgi:hypothetical protein
MASPLRVKNTAYFDIAAPLHYRVLGDACIARSLKAMRPPLDGQASKTNRPFAGEGTARGGQASEPARALAAKTQVRTQ